MAMLAIHVPCGRCATSGFVSEDGSRVTCPDCGGMGRRRVSLQLSLSWGPRPGSMYLTDLLHSFCTRTRKLLENQGKMTLSVDSRTGPKTGR